MSLLKDLIFGGVAAAGAIGTIATLGAAAPEAAEADAAAAPALLGTDAAIDTAGAAGGAAATAAPIATDTAATAEAAATPEEVAAATAGGDNASADVAEGALSGEADAAPTTGNAAASVNAADTAANAPAGPSFAAKAAKGLQQANSIENATKSAFKSGGGGQPPPPAAMPPPLVPIKSLDTPNIGGSPIGKGSTYQAIFGAPPAMSLPPAAMAGGGIPMIQPPPLVGSDRKLKTNVRPAKRSLKDFLSKVYAT